MKEVRAIQWTAGFWKVKSCCPHPLPENRLLLTGPIGPPYRPSVPLTEALFNCQKLSVTALVLKCTGPRGASKNIGLGRT